MPADPIARSILSDSGVALTKTGDVPPAIRAAALLELRRRQSYRPPPTPPEPADLAALPSALRRYREEEFRRELNYYYLEYSARGGRLEKGVIEKNFALERQTCRDDVHYWLNNYTYIPLPKAPPGALRQAPLTLWPRQEEMVSWIVESFVEGRDGVVNKGREVGATWMFLNVCLWYWMFEKEFFARLFGRKEGQVDDGTRDSLFGMIRWQLSLQPGFLRPPSDRIKDTQLRLLNLDNGSEIIGEATTPEAGRGARRGMVLFDEFARVDPAIQSQAWLSLSTVARSRFAVSTPNGKGNHFYELWTIKDDESKFAMNWRADPERDEEWFEGLLIENGGDMTWDQRAQEHEGSFAGVSGLRIVEAPDTALYDEEELPDGARDSWPMLATMDFGSGPSWTAFTVWLLNYDDGGQVPKSWADLCLTWQGDPADVIAGDILDALAEYGGMKWVFGDPAGWAKESDQESWGTRLNSLGVPIHRLPGWYNTADAIRATIDEWSELLKTGRMRIHRQRAAMLWETIESWQWKVPEGVPVRLLKNLETAKPNKDRFSHPGDTGRYAAGIMKRVLLRGRVMRVSRREQKATRAARRLEPSSGRLVAEAFEKMGPRLR